MIKRFLSLICIAALLLALGSAYAEKLDDVSICIGNSATETYYSRGGYVGSAKAANPSIVKAQPVSTSLTISSYLYYGTTVSFTGLAAGTTTVTLYSENGNWMGSVTVKVSNHSWDKEINPVFLAVENDNRKYVCCEYTTVKTCKTCGTTESQTETVSESTKALADVEWRTLQQKFEGDDVVRLQKRLTELGYYTGEISGILDAKTWSAVNNFKRSVGQTISASFNADEQQILFSTGAPKYDTSKKVSTVGSHPVLSPNSTGKQVESLQKRLSVLGYLNNQSGKYDSDTVRAVVILKMKLGFRVADGAVNSTLHALLEYGNDEDLAIDEAAYREYASIIDEALSQLQPNYKVQISISSNVRNKPSYEAGKLLWVNEGETFDYLGEENGWFIIAMPDGSAGYVPMDRSKIIEE